MVRYCEGRRLQVVAVVRKQVVGLRRVDLLQRLEVFQDHIHGEARAAQLDDLFRRPMVGCTGVARLNT